LTVVLPLFERMSLKSKVEQKLKFIPVVPDNGDGRAAEADGHIETSQVEADEGSNSRRRSAERRNDAGAALGGGRGSDRGSAVWDGGSKGLQIKEQLVLQRTSVAWESLR
jgi:hypothetical protein